MSLKEQLYHQYENIRQSYRMKKGSRHSWGNEKIHVVFVMQYVPSWGKVSMLFDSLLKEDAFEVFLVCLPEDLLARENETHRYFLDKGYDAINAKKDDGSWFDLKQLKPDYVFYTRPYDYYMPAEFQSHNVCMYTKICDITYAINLDYPIAEMIFSESFYRHTYMNFVEMEGGLVEMYQSIQKRGHQKGLLHSACFGYIALDEFLAVDHSVPSESWDFSNHDFRVIWAPRWTTDKKLGGSNFFTYKEFLFDYFRKHDNMDMLLRPHPLMFQNFLRTGEMTEEEVAEYRQKIENEPNMAFDSQKEYVSTFWQSDVLISDYSSIVAEYFLTEKPIIFCRTNLEIELLDNMNKMLEGCYVVDSEAELADCLDYLSKGLDEKKELRLAAKEELFGKTLGRSVELITAWLRSDFGK